MSSSTLPTQPNGKSVSQETGIVFTEEDITPTMAATWLQFQRRNRPLVENTVQKYMMDMASGNWAVTHQAIAFDQKGRLADGQHRLTAIVRLNRPVRLSVTRNVPEEVLDCIDGGTARSIASQVAIHHDVDHAKIKVPMNNFILRVINDGKPVTTSVKSMLNMIRYFEPDFAAIDRVFGKKNRTVFAALVFARRKNPVAVDAFTASFVSGANLQDGDPVLTLSRSLLIDHSDGSAPDKTTIFLRTLGAIHAYVRGQKWHAARAGRNALNYFLTAHKEMGAA